MFRLNVEGELSNGEHCFISDKNIVKKKFCLDYQGVWNPVGMYKYDKIFFQLNLYISYLGEWEYDTEKKTIRSNKSLTCLSTNGKDLSLEQCDSKNDNQKWDWNETYLSEKF